MRRRLALIITIVIFVPLLAAFAAMPGPAWFTAPLTSAQDATPESAGSVDCPPDDPDGTSREINPEFGEYAIASPPLGTVEDETVVSFYRRLVLAPGEQFTDCFGGSLVIQLDAPVAVDGEGTPVSGGAGVLKISVEEGAVVAAIVAPGGTCTANECGTPIDPSAGFVEVQPGATIVLSDAKFTLMVEAPEARTSGQFKLIPFALEPEGASKADVTGQTTKKEATWSAMSCGGRACKP